MVCIRIYSIEKLSRIIITFIVPNPFFIISIVFFSQVECSYSSIAPPPAYNSSSTHNHIALCNEQRHLVPSLPVSKATCSALFSPSNIMCSNNCAAIKSAYSQFAHHSSIPHSKSLDQYNETIKFPEHHSSSRHSFDQTISVNNCLDGCFYSKAGGNVHQPNCNRYQIPVSIPFSDHHYSQIGGFERGEPFIDPICCHTQNPHYDYPSNFNGRNSHQKPSNCNFPSQ